MTDAAIRDLPVDDLVLDADLNLRDRLDDDAVQRYAEAWDWIPPVTVFEIDGRWLLADGFHRHAAALMQNRRTLSAEIRTGTFDDALDFAAGANLRHGLPLSRAERRRAIEVKLRLHPDWSDRRLVEALGVGRETVARVRRQLVDAGQIPHDLGRVGVDGKTYTAGLPRDPNERLPDGRALAQQDDPRDRSARESDRAPWDDTTDPLAHVSGGGGDPNRLEGPHPPWSPDDRKAALADPIDPAAPTVDEMLDLMSKQVLEVVQWANTDGFDEAYRDASGPARARFQAAVEELSGRAGLLLGA